MLSWCFVCCCLFCPVEPVHRTTWPRHRLAASPRPRRGLCITVSARAPPLRCFTTSPPPRPPHFVSASPRPCAHGCVSASPQPHPQEWCSASPRPRPHQCITALPWRNPSHRIRSCLHRCTTLALASCLLGLWPPRSPGRSGPGGGGSFCLIRLEQSCPGRQATFPQMIQSWGLWPLLLVLPRMSQSGASARHLSLDNPLRDASGLAA